MAAATRVYTCFLLIWLITVTGGKTPDIQITCLFSEDCVLPCAFKPGGGEEVQWFKQDALVYSHPQSNGQPNEQFEGRASVSTRQLALGNASLLLKNCGPQDRGRYRCHIINGKEEKELFVIVKIEACIHSVNLDITRLSGFEEVKCSTQNVYPAPHVSWSTEPPLSLIPVTRKWPNKQGLFEVESKVKRQKDQPSITYICTMNSSYSTQTWRTSLTETVVNNVTLKSKSSSALTWTKINSAEGKDFSIPCKAPWDIQNFTLTWSFTRTNEPVVICTYDSRTQQMSNQWEDKAWLDIGSVKSGDGSLKVFSPQSLEHTGTYTCIISELQRKYEIQAAVNITLASRKTHSPAGDRMEMKTESSVPWWIPAVVIAILAVIAALIVGILKLKDDCLHSNNERDRHSQQVKVTVSESEAVSEGSHLTADPSNEHT